MPAVVVTNRARVASGHVWVHDGEIVSVDADAAPGDVVAVTDRRGHVHGAGLYNPASRIPVRLVAGAGTAAAAVVVDEALIVERVNRAAAHRRELPGVDEALCRTVWSEADDLPGLVVDRYGDVAVIQLNTLGFDLRRDLVVAAVRSALDVGSVYERSEGPARAAEGLEPSVGFRWGRPAEHRVLHTGAAAVHVDLTAGQKTGLYLDQLANHQVVGAAAAGRRVLDVFCHHGAFGIAASIGGAVSVTAVDSSATALESARRDAELNDVAVDFVEANAFDHLRHLDRSGGAGRFDLVVIDPPPFARSRRHLEAARRGYKELNLRALRLLEPGGRLVTFSCSHHVGRAELTGIVVEAAQDARRRVRLAETLAQRGDHPVLPAVPETEYLCGLVLEVIDPW